MNERFQNALQRIPQNVPPVWFMRQAGRYHDHYQALKQKYSFMQLCTEPELAAQVALGPIQDFDFDVAILFSDLLFPLQAMGFGLDYVPGPKLSFTLNETNITKLTPFEEAWPQLEFQKQAMIATRQLLPKKKSLIGFVGGPWTLFTYAAEGEHGGHLAAAKARLSLYERFCEQLMPILEKNIELQLEGGAEVVMIFDTAAGELDPFNFQDMCGSKLQKLADRFPGKLAYYSKGTMDEHVRDLRKNQNWAGFGFDHRWNLPSILRQTSQTTNIGFVQGNFDQALLFNSTADFKSQLEKYLETFARLTPQERAGWVSGLGHGVLPKTPQEHVRYFVQRVREKLA